MKTELNSEMKILLITSAISAFLIFLGIVTDIGVLGNAIILSVFLVSVPQLMMRYAKFRAFKEMEEKFPLFLRDMIESVRSGMPLHKSIILTSRFDYGKLSKEVKKAANQLTWGMPFDKVIDQFAERLKLSKRLYTAIKTIKESYLSGGDIVSILESVADTNIMLEESEKEKKSLLNQYVILMYAICFLFVGIVAAINRLMVPIFQVTSTGGAGEILGITNPCNICNGFECIVCSIFQLACAALSIATQNIGCYYTSLFLYISIVEAISCGMVAGQISENSITAGIKHSVIMTVVTFGAFSILVRIGIMGV